MFFGLLLLIAGFAGYVTYQRSSSEPKPPVYQLAADSKMDAAPPREAHWPKRALDRVSAVKMQNAERVSDDTD